MKGVCSVVLTSLVVSILFSNFCSAVILPFHIFTENGEYYDDPGVDLWVEVTNGFERADFVFHNESVFDCSIAQIFFDDGSLLGIDFIENGPGTLFSRAYPGPGNLPGGQSLIPNFVADREFNIGAVEPPPEHGVNSIPAGEWVKISFQLINNGKLEDVINELQTGQLRVGIHVIAFPDGSSNSAILTPEPVSLLLFGLGLPFIFRSRK